MADSLIVPCSSCRTLNRVPRSRMQDVPVCSECRERLFGQHPADLTTAAFDRFVTRSDLPVLVDFWAAWCGPCRVMAPRLVEASVELAGAVLVAKVDVDHEPELATRFGIQGIPTLVLLDHGQETARSSGALSTAQLVAWARAGVRRGVAS